MLMSSAGTADGEGNVTFENLVPGRYRLMIGNAALTHYVREIRLGSQLVTGDEVDLTSPQDTLSVSLALGKSKVRGLVKDAQGEPFAGAAVVLIPAPRRPFRSKLVQTDQDGMFGIAWVPPGDYYLGAFDRIENGALEDDEFLKPYLSKMTKIQVGDDSSERFELNVLTASGPRN
jgi:uncharacterized surface anchored protein